MELQAGKRYVTEDGRKTMELRGGLNDASGAELFVGHVGSALDRLWYSDGGHYYGENGMNIVAEAPEKPSLKSPVSTETRTVTETKIVSGVYGDIIVDVNPDGIIFVHMKNIMTASHDRLDAAAFVLTELAKGIRAKEAENV
jgi:hypothetical protein